MLHDKSLSVAAQVAAGLTNQGVELSPVNGSPLDVTMAAMQVMPQEGDAIANVKAAALPISTAFDQHTGEVRSAANMLAQRVKANLTLAQNTINPLCREIVLECEKRKRDIESDSALNIRVIPVKALSLFNSPDLDAKLQRFTEGTFRKVNIPKRLEELIVSTMNNQDAKAAMQKGTASWDTNIEEVFEALDEEGFGGPIDVLFKEPTFAYGEKSLLRNAVALSNFILLDAIMTGRVEKISMNDVSLEERTALAKEQAFYGQRLVQQIRSITSLANSGNFILTASSHKKAVYVYYRNYSQWLKKGGSAEALIAATANSDGVLSNAIDDLMHDPAAWEKRYTRIESHTRDLQRVDVIGRLQSRVEEMIYTYIHTELDDSAIAKSADLAKAYFEVNRVQANTDFALYVRKAVCAILAPNSAVETILNDMDYYIETHEDATLSKALAFSLGRLLGRQAAAQIRVTNTGNGGMMAEAPTL